MIDPVSVITAGVIFLVGWLTGRHAKLKTHPKPPEPYCLCGHHYGAHDPGDGTCRTRDTEDHYSTDRGDYQVTVPCPCRRYTGPQPVEQYWVPPASDMSIVTAPLPVASPRSIPLERIPQQPHPDPHEGEEFPSG